MAEQFNCTGLSFRREHARLVVGGRAGTGRGPAERHAGIAIDGIASSKPIDGDVDFGLRHDCAEAEVATHAERGVVGGGGEGTDAVECRGG